MTRKKNLLNSKGVIRSDSKIYGNCSRVHYVAKNKKK